jgi:hypothetical protein
MKIEKEALAKRFANTVSVGRMQAREYFLEELRK